MPAVATVSVGASAENPGGSCSSARSVAVTSSLDASPACSPVALVTTSSCWNPPRPEPAGAWPEPVAGPAATAAAEPRSRTAVGARRPRGRSPQSPEAIAAAPSDDARAGGKDKKVESALAVGRPRGSPRASWEQMPRARRESCTSPGRSAGGRSCRSARSKWTRSPSRQRQAPRRPRREAAECRIARGPKPRTADSDGAGDCACGGAT